MNNKTAFISGGSRGIGKATAIKLASLGMNIIFTYNSSPEDAEEVAKIIKSKGVKSAYFRLNVANPDDYFKADEFISSALNEIGESKFDFLINNAGIALSKEFMKTDATAFDNMMNIHFKSVFFITQKLVPLMNDNGAIINISSGTTRFFHGGYSLYAALKTATEGLTKYLAQELGNRGIRANIIAPGATETDFNGGLVRDNDKINAKTAANTALGRVGQPSDIAGAIAMLLSDDAKWINAQRIEVSGGQSL